MNPSIPRACTATVPLLASLLWLVTIVSAQAAPPWPTAGGDGGQTVEVTSLADGGPGSLREALAQPQARTVVFRVAGDILIAGPLVIDQPFITVAGETAPHPGISILGDKIRIRTHDVILRHLRVRVGETGRSAASNRDGISIEGQRSDRTPVGRILVDHCSIAWAVDENLSLWGKGVHDVAIRASIIAEALRNSVHPKGEHAMGMMVGPDVANVLVQGNLLAHNAWRNPVIHGGASAVVVNNLVYNPRYAGVHIYPHKESGDTAASVVGNVVVAGPDTKGRLPAFAKGFNPGTRVFYADNRSVGTLAFDPNERSPRDKGGASPLVEDAPIWFAGLVPLDSSLVEAAVLANAGARPWDRDRTDQRIVDEVVGRSGTLRDQPDDRQLVAPRPLAATAGTGG